MSNNGNIKIFISHRHDDSNLADIFRTHLNKWTRRDAKIVQTSDPGHSFRIGEPLTNELQNAINSSDLILFLYTVPDADWSYCSYEMGLAKNIPQTRIVVIQFGGIAPAPLEELVRVDYNENGIRAFADQFHREDTFFPRRNKPYAANLGDDDIYELSGALWADLEEERPIRVPRVIKRWLDLKLVLEISQELLALIRDSEQPDGEVVKKAQTTIDRECKVIADPNVLGIFGFAELSDGLTLRQLYERWRQDLKKWNVTHGANHKPVDWYSEMVSEMVRLIRMQPALEVQYHLKSVKSGDYTWYLPVINRANVLTGDCIWTFFVELYRITPSEEIHIQHKMTVLQSKKLNDLAIDRDFFKLYFRVCEKLDGYNQDDVNAFIRESILDTNETWGEFIPPFPKSEIKSLKDLYQMYSNNGVKLQAQIEKIIGSDNSIEDKKKEVYSLLRKMALDMKSHFRVCLENEEKGDPILPFNSEENEM